MKLNVNRKLKKGMWAMDGDKVGIASDFDFSAKGGPTVEFHYVGEDGSTTAVAQVPFESLRQAKLKEIPESRRPEAEFGKSLGYV